MSEVVRIGGFDYQIEEVKDLNNGRVGLNGNVNYTKLVIQLEKDLAPEFKMQVLWHEILHAIADHAGTQLKESTALALGYGIIQVLRDNPALGVVKSKTVQEDNSQTVSTMAKNGVGVTQS